MMSDSRSDDTSDSGGEDKEVASRRAQLKIFAKTHTSKAHHKAIKTSLKQDQVHELADNLYLVKSESDSETLCTLDMR